MRGAVPTVASLQGYRQQRKSMICVHASKCRTSSCLSRTTSARDGRKWDAHDDCCAIPHQRSIGRQTSCWWNHLAWQSGESPRCGQPAEGDEQQGQCNYRQVVVLGNPKVELIFSEVGDVAGQRGCVVVHGSSRKNPAHM